MNKIFTLLLFAAVIAGCKTDSGQADLHSWVEEMTISKLQTGYHSGEFTVREVTQAYLDRIEAIDRNGPTLNSIIAVNPEALEIADKLDKELAAGIFRGPMHGVPVILKDNIDTQDSMPTTAGSNALKGSFVKDDSFIAKKLREAGAVIIAKSNLSEWANFRANVSSSGWSAVGGQTKNPYILDRNPCGSSSGSGAAVSANLCMAAVGTETDGSIVCPSNNNGVVGIKPTVGLLSRTGIIPISYSQDTPGPMCRTVEDAAIMLGAMTGIDTIDPMTLGSEGRFLRVYTGYLKVDGLKGKIIGLIKDSGGYSDRVDSLVAEAVRCMKAAGAHVIEVEAPSHREYGDAELQILLYEFRDGINKYLAGLGDDAPAKNLTELIRFNQNDPEELKYFDQKVFIDADKKGDLTSAEYAEALKKARSATRENGIDKMLKDNGLDALISPTGAPAWKTDLVLGDHYIGGNSSLAAVAGYPSITVPMGTVGELPVGISFIGTAWSEPALIEIAYSYEQASKHRKIPRFLPTD